MCGICGIVNSRLQENQLPGLIGAMCDVITHRGPDEEGIFVEADVTLGMRRLSIIDINTGSQPIYNEDKTVLVFFNGEIYNFKTLRDDLVQKGHVFKTLSDTEVIVHLYEEYQEGFLNHLNGMFGVAVWDRKDRKLILARDRMGEKPLYWTVNNGTLIFGSEIKSLLCYPGILREMNPEAVYHYFTFKNVPAPLTAYKGIHKLCPAQYLVWKNRTATVKSYWHPRIKTERQLDDDREIAERLIHELKESVKMRMISDVPLGAFLSGGIDSSIMVAIMSMVSNRPVKTFSIGLDNEKISELPYAKAVSKRYQTDHHEKIVRPDALTLMDKMAWFFDEPFADSSAIPTYLVSEMTRKHVTVSISGDGGDELFGGYTRYQRILNRSNVGKIPGPVRKLLARLVGDNLPFGFKAKAFLQSLRYPDYRFFSIGTSEEDKQHLFSQSFLENSKSLSSYSVAAPFYEPSTDLLNQCMLYDMQAYLPNDIMTKVDRMSMANSLESRAPFLDHNLVEFALRIPSHKKITPQATKIVLKNTFKEYLPKELVTRPKTGFSIPLEEWFRTDLKPMVYELLSKSNIETNNVLNPDFVNTMVQQHMSGTRNHKGLIWSIIMFQMWSDNWIHKQHNLISSALEQRGF